METLWDQPAQSSRPPEAAPRADFFPAKEKPLICQAAADGLASASAPVPRPPTASSPVTLPGNLTAAFSAPKPGSLDQLQVDSEELEPPTPPSSPPPARGGAWTLPLLCAGLALIAACLLIPQANENRRLSYERQRLQLDLKHLQDQVAVNDEFLKRVVDDPALAERLAQRQMKVVREGTAVLEIKNSDKANEMSPFLLVAVAPPPALVPYKPLGGVFSAWCREPKSRIYVLATGLMLCAAGLIMGSRPDAMQV